MVAAVVCGLLDIVTFRMFCKFGGCLLVSEERLREDGKVRFKTCRSEVPSHQCAMKARQAGMTTFQ